MVPLQIPEHHAKYYIPEYDSMLGGWRAYNNPKRFVFEEPNGKGR